MNIMHDNNIKFIFLAKCTISVENGRHMTKVIKAFTYKRPSS